MMQDGSGAIDVSEMGSAFRMLGVCFRSQDHSVMSIYWHIETALLQNPPPYPMHSLLAPLFALGINLSKKEILNLIQEEDRDGTGRMQYLLLKSRILRHVSAGLYLSMV